MCLQYSVQYSAQTEPIPDNQINPGTSGGGQKTCFEKNSNTLLLNNYLPHAEFIVLRIWQLDLMIKDKERLLDFKTG